LALNRCNKQLSERAALRALNAKPTAQGMRHLDRPNQWDQEAADKAADGCVDWIGADRADQLKRSS
jgi:hypothetical protein